MPSEDGTAALRALAERGVRVRVLTNSLAATDVAPVHAGYAKYRKALLRGRRAALRAEADCGETTRDARTAHRRQLGREPAREDLRASTAARVFVGSFNFDPRSARLNTEMGFVIESPALATRLSQAFDRELPGIAYEVRLTSDGAPGMDRRDCPPYLRAGRRHHETPVDRLSLDSADRVAPVKRHFMRCIRPALLAAVLLASNGTALAQEPIPDHPALRDRFYFTLGAFYPRMDAHQNDRTLKFRQTFQGPVLYMNASF